MIDEGPSPEDIARFSEDGGAYCTECGAEISDLVEMCPKCGAFLEDGPSRHAPVESHFERKWIVLVIVITLVAFLWIVAGGLWR